MVEKTIEVSGKEVKFRSSAAVPRLYRAKFKRDIFKDFSKLEKSYKDNTDEGESFAIEDLEIFENVAYIMAYHADPTIPGTIEDWLDQFDMFSIYQVLPEILEMWGTNMMTDVASKKTKSLNEGNDHAPVSPAVRGTRHIRPRSGTAHYRVNPGYVDGKG